MMENKGTASVKIDVENDFLRLIARFGQPLMRLLSFIARLGSRIELLQSGDDGTPGFPKPNGR